MLRFLIDHGLLNVYYLDGFFFALFALWEWLGPRHRSVVGRPQRWVSNVGIVLVNDLMMRLVFTLLTVDLSYIAWKNGWGLLNHLKLSPMVSFLLTFLLLDFVAYAQHILFHKVPYAWRFHRMHHSDLEVDLTTGTRFHPFEALVSFIIRQGVVLVLGPLPAGVVIFDSLVIPFSFFNHANIRYPQWLDWVLRLGLVTPDMHRVHHSTDWGESNSNFGFIFPWWDFLFRTYVARPKAPQESMEIGLKEFRSPKFLGLGWLLAFPFLKKGD